jgi:hypothetical protein
LFGRFAFKGFVISLDAIIAVLIALTATAAVIGVISTSKSQSYSNMPLHRTAEDVLTLMDKQGLFRSMHGKTDAEIQTELESVFPSYIPVNMGARLNVTICTYTGSGFSCGRYFQVQKGSGGEYRSSARRIFADMPNNEYGLAVIEVWYE